MDRLGLLFRKKSCKYNITVRLFFHTFPLYSWFSKLEIHKLVKLIYSQESFITKISLTLLTSILLEKTKGHGEYLNLFYHKRENMKRQKIKIQISTKYTLNLKYQNSTPMACLICHRYLKFRVRSKRRSKRDIIFYPARALSVLGLLLSVSAPNVRWGKTFCRVEGSPSRNRP